MLPKPNPIRENSLNERSLPDRLKRQLYCWLYGHTAGRSYFCVTCSKRVH